MGAAEGILEDNVEKLEDFVLAGRHQVCDRSTLKYENNPKVGNLLEPIYQTRRIQVEKGQLSDLLVWWDKSDKSKAPEELNFESLMPMHIAILDGHPASFHEDHRALFVFGLRTAFYVPSGSPIVRIKFPIAWNYCDIYITDSTVTFLGSADSDCYGYQYPVKGPFDKPKKELYLPGARPLGFHKEENRLFYWISVHRTWMQFLCEYVT